MEKLINKAKEGDQWSKILIEDIKKHGKAAIKGGGYHYRFAGKAALHARKGSKDTKAKDGVKKKASKDTKAKTKAKTKTKADWIAEAQQLKADNQQLSKCYSQLQADNLQLTDMVHIHHVCIVCVCLGDLL